MNHLMMDEDGKIVRAKSRLGKKVHEQDGYHSMFLHTPQRTALRVAVIVGVIICMMTSWALYKSARASEYERPPTPIFDMRPPEQRNTPLYNDEQPRREREEHRHHDRNKKDD